MFCKELSSLIHKSLSLLCNFIRFIISKPNVHLRKKKWNSWCVSFFCWRVSKEKKCKNKKYIILLTQNNNFSFWVLLSNTHIRAPPTPHIDPVSWLFMLLKSSVYLFFLCHVRCLRNRGLVHIWLTLSVWVRGET